MDTQAAKAPGLGVGCECLARSLEECHCLVPWELGPGQAHDPDREIKDTLSVHFCGLLSLCSETHSCLQAWRVEECHPSLALSFSLCKKKSVGNSKHTGILGPQGETSVQTCRGAAGRPGPSSWGQGAGAPSLLFSSLDQPALTSGVEWDSPWGDLGCHLWHLLPVQKNKSECSALGFLNSCPSAETRQSAKRRKGGGQGLGRGRRGGEGGGGQGRCFGGRRSSPGWGAGRVGDAQASGVPRMGVGVRGPRGRGYPPVDDNGRSRPLGGLGWGKVRMLGLVLVRSLEWGVGVRREGG